MDKKVTVVGAGNVGLSVAKLLEARKRLSNLQRFMDGKVAAEDQLKALLKDPDLMKIYRDRQAGSAGSDEGSKS